MPKQSLDKETKKAILEARKMVEECAKKDLGEAETSRRVINIFVNIMGYDRLKHITQEYAVHTAGETTHCDIAIQVNKEDDSNPDILIECKKVNVDLTKKHLGQAVSYAINHGCDWVVLTNSKDWKLYHVMFSKPPQAKLIESWNLLNDEPVVIA